MPIHSSSTINESCPVDPVSKAVASAQSKPVQNDEYFSFVSNKTPIANCYEVAEVHTIPQAAQGKYELERRKT
jgi:hypothetical protein